MTWKLGVRQQILTWHQLLMFRVKENNLKWIDGKKNTKKKDSLWTDHGASPAGHLAMLDLVRNQVCLCVVCPEFHFHFQHSFIFQFRSINCLTTSLIFNRVSYIFNQSFILVFGSWVSFSSQFYFSISLNNCLITSLIFNRGSATFTKSFILVFEFHFHFSFIFQFRSIV